ncbi:TnsD family Tn7-like transposition protein [Undibacterium sp.]|uniref:TnsD family Tn7-like transposition protein n=1 Tax=Undibacterium sp. TaxID=1914977 RepID=UPI0025FA970F|nr:TnsD family Tn7-like transposition protein [Undibacterium sp.]
MLYYPTLYPDELTGSWLVRMCRHSGLPIKRLLRELFGMTASSHSIFLGNRIKIMSDLMALEPTKILWEHTDFPYIVAFMSSDKVKKYEEELLGNTGHQENFNLASFTGSVTKGVFFRRYCPMCCDEQMRAYGESFWHRSHMLPAVHMCTRHQAPLFETSIPVRGLGRIWSYTLPNEVSGVPAKFNLPDCVQLELARRTEHYLMHRGHHNMNWSAYYRELAMDKGYQFKKQFIASQRFSQDFFTAYDASFLLHAGCLPSLNKQRGWPALMLRDAKRKLPFSPVKHILLQVFLEQSDALQKEVDYKIPGRKSRNYIELDESLANAIQRKIKEITETDQRFKISELLQLANCWDIFRHHRAQLPSSVALVENFKLSKNWVNSTKE